MDHMRNYCIQGSLQKKFASLNETLKKFPQPGGANAISQTAITQHRKSFICGKGKRDQVRHSFNLEINSNLPRDPTLHGKPLKLPRQLTVAEKESFYTKSDLIQVLWGQLD